MTFTEQDAAHLDRAFELAEKGRAGARPNPIVGAVLAVGGDRLAEGHHERYGGPHAERVALEGATVGPDATLYVTLEPCAHTGQQPPCADLVIESGVRRVVIAGADPSIKTAGIGPARLIEAGLEVVWAPSNYALRAAEQNAGFLCRHLRGRPFVTYKWAMSANGRITTGNSRQPWISSPISRDRVHRMRAASGAVAVGINTVRADNSRLTVRGPAGDPMVAPPVRVIYDRRLDLGLETILARTARQVPVLVFTTVDASPERETALSECGVEVVRLGENLLEASLAELAGRTVNDVLLESGPGLATALLEAGLIDRLVCFRSPDTLDPELVGLDPGAPLLQALEGGEEQRCGRDLQITRLLTGPELLLK